MINDAYAVACTSLQTISKIFTSETGTTTINSHTPIWSKRDCDTYWLTIDTFSFTTDALARFGQRHTVSFRDGVLVRVRLGLVT